MEIWSSLVAKIVEQNVNTLFNNVLGETDKYVFLCLLKHQRNFGTFLTGLWVRSGNRGTGWGSSAQGGMDWGHSLNYILQVTGLDWSVQEDFAVQVWLLSAVSVFKCALSLNIIDWTSFNMATGFPQTQMEVFWHLNGSSWNWPRYCFLCFQLVKARYKPSICSKRRNRSTIWWVEGHLPIMKERTHGGHLWPSLGQLCFIRNPSKV